MGNDWQKFRELSENEIFKKYELIDKKGEKRFFGGGGYALIHKARRILDRKYFFIKVIGKTNLSSEQFGLICNEVEHLMSLSHSNVTQLFETYETTYRIYLVLEYVPGGEVIDRLLTKGNFTEKEAAHLVANVASGLSYLHAQGICHRDIKPENLYYASSDMFCKVKIGDFVLSKSTSRPMHTVCGTANYVAPEVLLQGVDDSYGKEVDLWGLGIVLFCLLCGYPPFSSNSIAELYKLIKKGDFDFHDPYWTDISPEAKDLVSKLIVVDPAKRYTAEQVLRHNWIKTLVHPSFIEEYKGPRRVDIKGISDKEREEGKEKKKSFFESFLFLCGAIFGSPIGNDIEEQVEKLGRQQIRTHTDDIDPDEEHERAHLLMKHRANILALKKDKGEGETKEDGLIVKYERLFDDKLAKINVQIAALTTVCFLCILVLNEDCFDTENLLFDDSYKNCPIAFWLKMVAWLIWGLIFWRLIVYYAIKCERKKIIWGYENRIEAFVRSRLWIRFFVELLVNAIMPIPVWSNWGLENNILVAVCFLRFYTWLRVLRDFSPLHKHRYKLQRVKKFVSLGLEVDSKTMLIWVFTVAPISAMCVLIFLTIIIFAYLIYLTERQFWINFNTGEVYRALDYDGALPDSSFSQAPLSNFQNACWFSIVTMASVGYGDILAYGWQGRVMASLEVIVGTALTSLLSSVIITQTNMSQEDLIVVHTLQWKEHRRALYILAADLIKRFVQHRIRQKQALRFLEGSSAGKNTNGEMEVEVEMTEIQPSTRPVSRSASATSKPKAKVPLTPHARWNLLRIHLKSQFKRFHRARVKLARLENRLLEEKGVNVTMQTLSKKTKAFGSRLDELEKITAKLYPQTEQKKSMWKTVTPKLSAKNTPESKTRSGLSGEVRSADQTGISISLATETKKQVGDLAGSKAYMRPSIRAIVDSKRKQKPEDQTTLPNGSNTSSTASSKSNSKNASRSGSTRDLELGNASKVHTGLGDVELARVNSSEELDLFVA